MTQSDYITTDELKAALELTGTAFADYDIPRAISAASRGVDEYTDRFFYSGTQTRYYDWYGSPCITIDDFTSLATVTVDYDRDNTFETTWTQTTDFLIAPYNAAYQDEPYERIELLPVVAYRRPVIYPARIKTVGTFGWPAVPAPVKEATTILASRLFRRVREAPFGVVGLGIDNATVRVSRTDPDVAFLLDPFMKGDGALAA